MSGLGSSWGWLLGTRGLRRVEGVLPGIKLCGKGSQGEHRDQGPGEEAVAEQKGSWLRSLRRVGRDTPSSATWAWNTCVRTPCQVSGGVMRRFYGKWTPREEFCA